MSYEHIKSLDEFWEKLWQRAREQLTVIEPQFVNRLATCHKLGIPFDKSRSESVPLLSGEFDTFIDLIESLHEVRYYWKRLSEASRLFKASPTVKTNPLPTGPPLSESEWFIYHLDFWWHAAYGLFDRFEIFVTRLERRLALSKDSDARKYISSIRNRIKQTHKEIAKVRDPVAHYCSQGLQGLRKDHIWEESLALNIQEDEVAVYDEAFMLHRDFYEKHVSYWTTLIQNVVLGETFSMLIEKVPFDKIKTKD